MAVFDILEHPGKGPEEAVFVREGFSMGALVFSVVWALWHRMWVVATGLVVVFAALALSTAYLGLPDTVAGIFEAGLSLLFGFEAQALRAASLRRVGFRDSGIVMAGSLEEAELKHAMATRPRSQSPKTATSWPMQAPTDTLGLFGNV